MPTDPPSGTPQNPPQTMGAPHTGILKGQQQQREPLPSGRGQGPGRGAAFPPRGRGQNPQQRGPPPQSLHGRGQSPRQNGPLPPHGRGKNPQQKGPPPQGRAQNPQAQISPRGPPPPHGRGQNPQQKGPPPPPHGRGQNPQQKGPPPPQGKGQNPQQKGPPPQDRSQNPQAQISPRGPPPPQGRGQNPQQKGPPPPPHGRGQNPQQKGPPPQDRSQNPQAQVSPRGPPPPQGRGQSLRKQPVSPRGPPQGSQGKDPSLQAEKNSQEKQLGSQGRNQNRQEEQSLPRRVPSPQGRGQNLQVQQQVSPHGPPPHQGQILQQRRPFPPQGRGHNPRQQPVSPRGLAEGSQPSELSPRADINPQEKQTGLQIRSQNPQEEKSSPHGRPLSQGIDRNSHPPPGPPSHEREQDPQQQLQLQLQQDSPRGPSPQDSGQSPGRNELQSQQQQQESSNPDSSKNRQGIETTQQHNRDELQGVSPSGPLSDDKQRQQGTSSDTKLMLRPSEAGYGSEEPPPLSKGPPPQKRTPDQKISSEYRSQSTDGFRTNVQSHEVIPSRAQSAHGMPLRGSQSQSPRASTQQQQSPQSSEQSPSQKAPPQTVYRDSAQKAEGAIPDDRDPNAHQNRSPYSKPAAFIPPLALPVQRADPTQVGTATQQQPSGTTDESHNLRQDMAQRIEIKTIHEQDVGHGDSAVIRTQESATAARPNEEYAKTGLQHVAEDHKQPLQRSYPPREQSPSMYSSNLQAQQSSHSSNQVEAAQQKEGAYMTQRFQSSDRPMQLSPDTPPNQSHYFQTRNRGSHTGQSANSMNMNQNGNHSSTAQQSSYPNSSDLENTALSHRPNTGSRTPAAQKAQSKTPQKTARGSFVNFRGGDNNDVPSDTNSRLYESAKRGQLDKVIQCCNLGANVNSRHGKYGETALYAAAARGYTPVARFLVEDMRADVDSVKEFDGTRALLRAAFRGDFEMCKLLITNGADYNATDNNGFTPLHVVAQEGHVNIIMYLCQQPSILIDPENKDGTTPYILAAQDGRLDVLKLLTKFGANANQVTLQGWTPLHFATSHSRREVVEFLLNCGADPLAKTKESKKIALELAKDESVCIINMRYLVRMNLDQVERLEMDRTQNRMRLDTAEKFAEHLKQQNVLRAKEVQTTETKLDQRISEVETAFERDLTRHTEALNAELSRQIARFDRRNAEVDKNNEHLHKEIEKVFTDNEELNKQVAEGVTRYTALEGKIHTLKRQVHGLEGQVQTLEGQVHGLEGEVHTLKEQLQLVIERLTQPALNANDLQTISNMASNVKINNRDSSIDGTSSTNDNND